MIIMYCSKRCAWGVYRELYCSEAIPHTQCSPKMCIMCALWYNLGWSPSWVYPVEVLHQFLGSKDEQHVLASSKQAAAAAGGPKVLATTLWLKTDTQVAQNDRGAKAHHHEQVSCHFEPSSPFYGPISVSKWPFWGCFHDDRPENSGRSPVCRVGVSDEGRCSSIAIGLSNDGKWVFNEACTMPWCHTVVHFEVKMSRF